MVKAKRYKRREFIRILLDNGFVYERTRGGHDIYKRWQSTHFNSLFYRLEQNANTQTNQGK